jgi:hypothetical protein
MEVLIKMLKNTKENTYHPIWYMVSFFIAGELNDKIKRYKSKGHRTTGFTNRQDAVNSIKTELTDILKVNGYIIHEELDEVDDMLWDGEDMPIDIQLRPVEDLKKN